MNRVRSKSLEGIIGRELPTRSPSGPRTGAQKGSIPYGIAENMDTPNPDAGEEFQHVNTQLFGTIDPPSNRGVLAEK